MYLNQEPQTSVYLLLSPYRLEEVHRIANRSLCVFIAVCNDARRSIFNTTVGCLLVSQHFGILQHDMMRAHGRDGMCSPCRAQLLIFSVGQLYT